MKTHSIPLTAWTVISVCAMLSWPVLVIGWTDIPIENPSFEEPGTEKIKGWDGDCSDPAWTGSLEDIPGWTCDAPAFDSGVETGWTPTEGLWTAFVATGDSAVYQIPGYVIEEGDIIELDVDSRITWNATTLEMRLFYSDDKWNFTMLTVERFELTESMAPYSIQFKASDNPGCVGMKLGLGFANASDLTGSWIGLDNVLVSNLKITGLRGSQPVPASVSLAQNYPNPFNPSTEILYSLKAAAKVHLSVFDLEGREAAVLEDGVRGAGEHRLSFQAAGLPSGVYICRLETDAGVLTRRMVLQK
jgi:hypothetical protein